MKLEVIWRSDEEPEHARIENLDNFADTNNGATFKSVYVDFSGFFGPYNPHLFAAAPELYDALEDLLTDLAIGLDLEGALKAAESALAKARGEKWCTT